MTKLNIIAGADKGKSGGLEGFQMWALFELLVFVLQVLSLLPRSPSTEQRPANLPPDWVRWPIYGVIALGVLALGFAWIMLLLVD